MYFVISILSITLLISFYTYNRIEKIEHFDSDLEKTAKTENTANTETVEKITDVRVNTDFKMMPDIFKIYDHAQSVLKNKKEFNIIYDTKTEAYNLKSGNKLKSINKLYLSSIPINKNIQISEEPTKPIKSDKPNKPTKPDKPNKSDKSEQPNTQPTRTWTLKNSGSNIYESVYEGHNIIYKLKHGNEKMNIQMKDLTINVLNGFNKNKSLEYPLYYGSPLVYSIGDIIIGYVVMTKTNTTKTNTTKNNMDITLTIDDNYNNYLPILFKSIIIIYNYIHLKMPKHLK